MEAVYVLAAIVCNVGVGCVEFPFERMEFPTYRECMREAYKAERDNRHHSGMKNVTFQCDRELRRTK